MGGHHHVQRPRGRRRGDRSQDPSPGPGQRPVVRGELQALHLPDGGPDLEPHLDPGRSTLRSGEPGGRVQRAAGGQEAPVEPVLQHLQELCAEDHAPPGSLAHESGPRRRGPDSHPLGVGSYRRTALLRM